MSFSPVLMRNSHSLLSLTSPCSHPLLPPPYYSPCLTLTVIRFGHLLLEPTPTCLPPITTPYIPVLTLHLCPCFFFCVTVCMLRLCLVSYHAVYLIGQVTPVSSHESLCAVGWTGAHRFSQRVICL